MPVISKYRSFLIALAMVLLAAGQTATADEPVFITIGSGDPTGVYYQAGLTMAKLINAKRDAYGIRATVESTRGSIFNINALMAGHLEFGLAQSDNQYHTVMGMSEGAEKARGDDLRSVFSLHRETINLVAAVDAGIETISDLKGKRVNLGNLGSGQYDNAIDALLAVGIDPEKDILSETANAYEAADLLQDKRIDAFFCTLGHPNETLRSATSGNRKVRFIPVDGRGIDEMVMRRPYYVKATIPVTRYYPGAKNREDVESFSVIAILCTSANVPEDVVYTITREVMENFDHFQSQHPAFADLSKDGMLTGLTAPLHPGALRYFRQIGLMN